jgi:hypothetical protein
MSLLLMMKHFKLLYCGSLLFSHNSKKKKDTT